jgi:hypothetical protein
MLELERFKKIPKGKIGKNYLESCIGHLFWDKFFSKIGNLYWDGGSSVINTTKVSVKNKKIQQKSKLWCFQFKLLFYFFS